MGYKSYSDSTLRSMTKDDLIRLVRMLEHNWQGAEESLNNQAKSLQIMFKDYRPVKHGKWIPTCDIDGEVVCENCSVCGMQFRVETVAECGLYCQHCGAKNG